MACNCCFNGYKNLETAVKIIPSVLVLILCCEKVALISIANDSSSHNSTYSQNYATRENNHSYIQFFKRPLVKKGLCVLNVNIQRLLPVKTAHPVLFWSDCVVQYLYPQWAHVPADPAALHLNQVFPCAVTCISASVGLKHSPGLYNNDEKDKIQRIKGQNSIKMQESFGGMKNCEKQPFDFEN